MSCLSTGALDHPGMLTVWIMVSVQLGQLWSPTRLWSPTMQGGVVRGQGLWGWCDIKVPQL